MGVGGGRVGKPERVAVVFALLFKKKKLFLFFYFLFFIFTVVQLQLSAFSPYLLCFYLKFSIIKKFNA